MTNVTIGTTATAPLTMGNHSNSSVNATVASMMNNNSNTANNNNSSNVMTVSQMASIAEDVSTQEKFEAMQNTLRMARQLSIHTNEFGNLTLESMSRHGTIRQQRSRRARGTPSVNSEKRDLQSEFENQFGLRFDKMPSSRTKRNKHNHPNPNARFTRSTSIADSMMAPFGRLLSNRPNQHQNHNHNQQNENDGKTNIKRSRAKHRGIQSLEAQARVKLSDKESNDSTKTNTKTNTTKTTKTTTQGTNLVPTSVENKKKKRRSQTMAPEQTTSILGMFRWHSPSVSRSQSKSKSKTKSKSKSKGKHHKSKNKSVSVNIKKNKVKNKNNNNNNNKITNTKNLKSKSTTIGRNRKKKNNSKPGLGKRSSHKSASDFSNAESDSRDESSDGHDNNPNYISKHTKHKKMFGNDKNLSIDTLAMNKTASNTLSTNDMDASILLPASRPQSLSPGISRVSQESHESKEDNSDNGGNKQAIVHVPPKYFQEPTLGHGRIELANTMKMMSLQSSNDNVENDSLQHLSSSNGRNVSGAKFSSSGNQVMCFWFFPFCLIIYTFVLLIIVFYILYFVFCL